MGGLPQAASLAHERPTMSADFFSALARTTDCPASSVR
jgi:hypothetical protein